MSGEWEHYQSLKSKRNQPESSGKSMYADYLARRGDRVSSMADFQFEPPPQPAASTAVSPDIGRRSTKYNLYGVIPKGSTERFVEQTYPPRKEPTSALNVAENFATGVSQTLPAMGMSALEDPVETAKRLAKFFPEAISRAYRAIGGTPLDRLPGLGPPVTKEEQLKALHQLGITPEELLFLALGLRGLGKSIGGKARLGEITTPIETPAGDWFTARKPLVTKLESLGYDHVRSLRKQAETSGATLSTRARYEAELSDSMAEEAGYGGTWENDSVIKDLSKRIHKAQQGETRDFQAVIDLEQQAQQRLLEIRPDLKVRFGIAEKTTKAEALAKKYGVEFQGKWEKPKRDVEGKIIKPVVIEPAYEFRDPLTKGGIQNKSGDFTLGNLADFEKELGAHRARFGVKSPAIAKPEKPVLAGEKEVLKPKGREPWEMTKREFVRQEAASQEAYSKQHIRSQSARDNALISARNSAEVLHKREVRQALSEGKPVPAEVLKDYPDLAAKAKTSITEPQKEAIELGFLGFTPQSVKALGTPIISTARSISNVTSTMAKEIKIKPEIQKAVEQTKQTLIEHDRYIRQSEMTNKMLTKVVNDAIPKDRQMSMIHAYEQKMQGKYWNELSQTEKDMVRFLGKEKAKLNKFIEDNKILETMKSEDVNHIFHQWINPETGKPYEAMYGKFSKGLPQAKQRTIPTYETGITQGLKPATTNLGELIGMEWESAMRAHQARQVIKTVHNIGAEKGTNIQLTVRGKPRPIRMVERWDLLAKQGLTEGYQRYSHYAFDKPITFVDASGQLTRLRGAIGVREEIYPFLRAYVENPTYNAYDKLNFASRSFKLGLSMFHPVSLAMQELANIRIPFKNIPRGLRLRKDLGSIVRLLYQEGLELYKTSEQMGFGKISEKISAPIFKIIQPGMKTSFAHDLFLRRLPDYLKGTDWTTEKVLAAFDAGKPIPKKVLQLAREVVQKADGHFSGEHYKRSLLETNRFMAKWYFSPEARAWWQRLLLSPTWQREHLLVAKNVVKSFMPDKMIKKLGLSELGPIKKDYRRYAYGGLSIIAAVDMWNLMTTQQMDGEAKHLWQNPKGKGFAVRAPWDEPSYTITDDKGKTRTISGGPAYIRPLKSLFEVAEWVHDPLQKAAYKLSPLITAIIAQMPNQEYRNYEGLADIPKRIKDFLFDVYEPISIDQLVRTAQGKQTPQKAVLPFFGMPVSKLTENNIRSEIKKKQSEGDLKGAMQLQADWNRKHSENKIKLIK